MAKKIKKPVKEFPLFLECGDWIKNDVFTLEESVRLAKGIYSCGFQDACCFIIEQINELDDKELYQHLIEFIERLPKQNTKVINEGI